MSLKAKLEAIVYAAEAPVTLDQIVQLVKDSVIVEAGQESGPIDDAEVRSHVRAALEELVTEFAGADHGVEIRQVAGQCQHLGKGMRRLDFRDARTMALVQSLPVQCKGVDHMEFTADGRFAIATCEFSGQLLKLDLETRASGELSPKFGVSAQRAAE